MHNIDLAPVQDFESTQIKNDPVLVIDHAILRNSICWIVAKPSAFVFIRNRAKLPVALLKMHDGAPALTKLDSAITAVSEDNLCW